jgi:hypothetical protein
MRRTAQNRARMIRCFEKETSQIPGRAGGEISVPRLPRWRPSAESRRAKEQLQWAFAGCDEIRVDRVAERGSGFDHTLDEFSK